MERVLPIVVVCISISILVVALADTGARRLALAYVRRRRAQSLLICAGIFAATVMIASTSVATDSFTSSIRRSVTEQLGPVDEEVVRSGVDSVPLDAAVRDARVAGVADTLPMVAMAATVRSRNFVARVAQAQIIEMRFEAARNFGRSPSDTGITGPTPTGDSAVIGADLADAIAIRPGQRVTIYAFGRERTLSVTRVARRRGIAGIRTPLSPTGSASMNVFVPAGTIREMVGSPSSTLDVGQGTPVALVAIANVSGANSNAVVDGLRRAATAQGADVRPVRQQLIDDGQRQSRPFAGLFRAISFVGVLAAVALLLLSLSIVRRDRVRAVATLRAYGIDRRRVLVALSFEGWTYALAGTVAGALVAIPAGEAVVLLARHVFATPEGGNVALVYSGPAATLIRSSSISFLIAFCIAVAAGLTISRQNIVDALRPVSDRNVSLDVHGRHASLVFCAVGVALTGGGIRYTNIVGVLIGPSLIALGIVAAFPTQRVRRWLVPALSLGVLVWSFAAIAVFGRAIHFGAALLITEALLTTGCVLTFFRSPLLQAGRLGGQSHRLRAFTLALSYALRPSRRVLLVATTYALLLFMLTVFVTAREMFRRDTTTLARHLGGRSTLEVTSNAATPLPGKEVQRLDGVTNVLAATAVAAQLNASSGDATRDVTAVGIDAAWIARASPPLAADEDPARQLETYAAVVNDPTKILVASDLYADRLSGFPLGVPRVGDHVTLRVPTSGRIRTLTVAGVLSAGRYNGSDHVYVTQPVLDELLGGKAVSNLLYVQTTASVNPDVVAAVIDGTHLRNGTYARSFARLARESTSAREQFLDITAGYASIGLIVALVGLGAVMIDRVRARQRHITVLRAFGVRSTVVQRAVRVEAAIVTLVGTLTGIACGTLFMAQVNRVHAIAPGSPSLAAPVVPLALGLMIVIGTSILATTVASRRVARLQLARTLHVDL